MCRLLIAISLLLCLSWASSKSSESILIDRSAEHIIYTPKAETLSLPMGKIVRFEKNDLRIFLTIVAVGEMGFVDFDVAVARKGNQKMELLEYLSKEVFAYRVNERTISLGSIGTDLVFIDSDIIKRPVGWSYCVVENMPDMCARGIKNVANCP